MSLADLFRPPLCWLALAELLIVGVLVAVLWHAWDARQPAPAVAAAPPRSLVPGSGRRPPPRPSAPPSVLPTNLTPPAGPTPGIRTDPDFLARQMNELNRVEAAFAEVEWRATKATADAIRHYLDRVVLPAVERAERGGR
jgi:hypothetical protein